MVLITIVNGVYKPTYNWGAPHCNLYIYITNIYIYIHTIAGPLSKAQKSPPEVLKCLCRESVTPGSVGGFFADDSEWCLRLCFAEDLAGGGSYDALPTHFLGLMEKEFNLNFENARQRSSWKVKGLLRRVKLCFWPTDKTPKLQQRCLDRHGNVFLNSYLLIIFATCHMAECLRRRFVQSISSLLCWVVVFVDSLLNT